MTNASAPSSSGAPSTPPPLRPAPPLAKRLNRNALTVAAVIMGITVLTAVVLLNPSHDASSRTAQARASRRDDSPPIPTRPTFLDVPVRQTPAQRADSSSKALAPQNRSDGEGLTNERSTGRAFDASTLDGAARFASSSSALSDGSTQPSVRERAYLAAVASPAVIAASTGRGTALVPGDSSNLASEESKLLNLGDSVLRSSMQSGPSTVGTQPAISGSRTAEGRRAFLDAAGDSHGSTVVARLEPAGTPYTLRAGSVVPGVLLTGISSDLPGDIVGQVSRNVYDSRTQRILLIPKGSRLVGTYDNQIASGQNRLLVAWTRLILPDGESMRLPGLALKDPQGQTGARGDVDNHWRRVFGNALLLSAIGAGVQLSQPQQASIYAPPSAGQVAAGALGQELSNVALEIIRRGMDVQPTISIRQGQSFNVFLNGDLVFPGPYESTAVAGR